MFLEYALPLWLEEVDTTNYTALGVLSGSVDPDGDNLERLLTLDAEGHGYVGIDEGLRLVNLTQPPVPNSANNNNPGPPGCPGLQAVLPLGASQQISFLDPVNGLSLYIGGVPAPLLQGGTAINVPASSVTGPADMECVDAYGHMTVAIADVSYGVDPLALSASLLPPTGNPSAYLFGWGFYGPPELSYTTNPPFQGSVDVGGEPATGAVTLGPAGLSSTLGALAFHIPNGSAGESANVANASVSGSIAITKFNTVIEPGDPGLVLDLSTSTFSALPYFGADVIRASADGTHLYTAALNVTSGEMSSIDPSTYAVQSESFGQIFWTDLAVSSDGTQVAAVDAPPYAAGDSVGFFDSNLHYLNANAYPDFSPPDDTGVLGATFSPGAKVLVVALGDSIEFWDAVGGTLRARLMTPEELHVLVYPEGAVAPVLALDPIGQTIYAISASGLTVIKLPVPLDQLSSFQWPLALRLDNTQPWLHGPIASRMAVLRKKMPLQKLRDLSR